MIRVDKRGTVTMLGVLKPYQQEIGDFVASLNLPPCKIKYQDNRLVFPNKINESDQQRIRNFILNLPALKRLR